MLKLNLKSFIVVHIIPALQIIALLGIVPAFTPSLANGNCFAYMMSIQFFIALIVYMNIYLTRAYQIVAMVLLLTCYFVVFVGLLNKFSEDDTQEQSATAMI